MPDCGDEGQTSDQFHAIRLQDPPDVLQDHLILRIQFVIRDDDRHRINTGGRMLVTDAVRLQDLQHLPAEPALRVHQYFLYVDHTEARPSGDADDRALRKRTFGDDPRARMIGIVCVPDVDRDV